MAHFAKLNENNLVTQVITVDNSDTLDDLGVESEVVGTQFCTNLLGGTWIQTSYNGNTRKNYAGNGYTYDTTRDAFIAPQPYPSWTLVEDTCLWEAPVAKPAQVLDAEGQPDGKYNWDEETLAWVKVTE